MNCSTCKYFDVWVNLQNGLGVCRRRSPIANSTYGFPQTSKDNWCGEYEHNESKGEQS